MIFEVSVEDVKSLSDTALRELLAKLSQQDVRKAGQSAKCVKWGGHQLEADGGVDIRIDCEPETQINGFVSRPKAIIQVKAETMPPSKIMSEMKPKGSLRESIAELAEAGGMYVIASSKDSVADPRLKQRVEAMREAVSAHSKADQLEVDFFGARRIASWVNQYPGIINWVYAEIGKSVAGWQPYRDWSSSPEGIESEYIVDEGLLLKRADSQHADGLSVEQGLNQLRAVLGAAKGAVRLTGMSGVGKTRLVQALFDERVGEKPLSASEAVYTDIADSPSPSPVDLLETVISNEQDIVMIVDNCGVALHGKLIGCLQRAKSNVRVITIEYDIRDALPESTGVFSLEPATDKVIEEGLKRKFPRLTNVECQHLAEFAGGNWRVAFAIAETAKSGETLTKLSDQKLFERLFHQKNQVDKELLSAAKVLSLVYSFEGTDLESDDSELAVLASLAGISPSDLYKHVAELHRRKLVQKRGPWRAVLPHALANRMSIQALEEFPLQTLRSVFEKPGRERLLMSFAHRLGFLHESEIAQEIATAWLEQSEFFKSVGSADETRLRTFKFIAPVSPTQTLAQIERYLEETPDWFETSSDENKREIVTLLRHIAYDDVCFDRATNVIVKFATKEAEDRFHTTSASVLESFFTIYLSGTHATAKRRAALLVRLANDGSEKCYEIAKSCLKQMLETGHFTSSFEFGFGARKRDYGFYPRINREIWDWYKAAMNAALVIADLGPKKLADIKRIAANKFTGLLLRSGPFEQTIEFGEQLHRRGGWNEGLVAARRALRKLSKQKEGIPELSKIEAFAESLMPQTLLEKITVYVLPESHGYNDLADVDFDDEEKHEKSRQKINELSIEVGKELSRSSDINDALKLLLSSRSHHVCLAMEVLGKHVENPHDVWLQICEVRAVKDRSALIGAASFLKGLNSKDTELVGEILDNMLSNPASREDYPWSQSIVGWKGGGVERVLRSFELDIPIDDYDSLAWAESQDDLKGSNLRLFVERLCEHEGGVLVAARFLDMHQLRKRPDGESLLDETRELIREVLLKVPFSDKDRDHDNDVLGELCDAIAHTEGGDVCEEFLTQISDNLIAGFRSQNYLSRDYSYVVRAVMKATPHIGLTAFVLNSTDINRYGRSWLNSSRNAANDPIEGIDEDTLFDWVGQDYEERGPALAKEMRYTADGETEHQLHWLPKAFRLIRDAPNPNDVLQEFFDRFEQAGWSGTMANKLLGQRALLDDLQGVMSGGDDWLSPFYEQIDRSIAWWRSNDLDSDRKRDQRFE